MLGVHHPLLKSIRKAVRRGGLTEDGLAVAEGFHLLEEALRTGTPVEAVVAVPAAAEILAGWPQNLPLHLVDDATLDQISSLENGQGVLSLLRIVESPLDALFDEPALLLILDGVQDPGNAGAMLRSAEAFGASGVCFLKGSVNPFNPKTLRATAGSILRLPFAQAEWADVLAAVKQHGVALFAASPRGSITAAKARFAGPVAFLIGNEGRGIPPEHERAAIAVRIPTQGVESLNAALAAGILLYEARRQRGLI